MTVWEALLPLVILLIGGFAVIFILKKQDFVKANEKKKGLLKDFITDIFIDSTEREDE